MQVILYILLAHCMQTFMTQSKLSTCFDWSEVMFGSCNLITSERSKHRYGKLTVRHCLWLVTGDQFSSGPARGDFGMPQGLENALHVVGMLSTDAHYTGMEFHL